MTISIDNIRRQSIDNYLDKMFSENHTKQLTKRQWLPLVSTTTMVWSLGETEKTLTTRSSQSHKTS